MEHQIFLAQMISLVLAAASVFILVYNYRYVKQRGMLIFSCAILLQMVRTAFFALARYGNVTRLFIIPEKFAMGAQGGLLYTSLVYVSHLLLIGGMFSLVKRRVHPIAYISASLPSLYSVVLFILVILNIVPSVFPCWLTGINSLAVAPVLLVKTVLLVTAIYLTFHCSKADNGIRLKAFYLILAFGQIFDGLFYAFSPFRGVTLVLSVFLPYGAYLFLLPSLWGKHISHGVVGGGMPTEEKLESLCSKFNLGDDEKKILLSILHGKSNKEIAFENGITLSMTKHRIYKIYKKCRINSRWELINLAVQQE